MAIAYFQELSAWMHVWLEFYRVVFLLGLSDDPVIGDTDDAGDNALI